MKSLDRLAEGDGDEAQPDARGAPTAARGPIARLDRRPAHPRESGRSRAAGAGGGFGAGGKCSRLNPIAPRVRQVAPGT